MSIREVQVLLPIVRGDVVFAGADVIADCVADGMIDRRHFIHAEALFLEQFVDGLGGFCGEEFAARIGALVELGARDVDGARRPNAISSC